MRGSCLYPTSGHVLCMRIFMSGRIHLNGAGRLFSFVATGVYARRVRKKMIHNTYYGVFVMCVILAVHLHIIMP